MRTTIELPDTLVREVKAVAAAEGTSMRSVVEQALRRALDRRRSAAEWTPRSDLVFGGDGLTEEALSLAWMEVLELSRRDARLMSKPQA